MDKVIEQTQVYKVWGFAATQVSYTPPYPNAIATGAGVYVGIVDTGIRYQHADFRPTDSTTKIKFIWDHTQLGNPPGEYTYGREWNETEILTGVCTSTDTDAIGRGTHLAGIAAACGRATAGTWSAYRYVGMAPEANILAVKVGSLAYSEDWRGGGFPDYKIRDAVQWCFNRAGSAPCVVIVPQGYYRTGHDGTGVLDQMLSSITGPGKIVVTGIGQDRRYQLHAQVNLTSVGQQTSVTYLVPTFSIAPTGEYVEHEAWHNPTASFSVRLVSPNGISTGWVVPGTQVNIADTADGSLQVQNALPAQSTPVGKRIYWRIYETTEGIMPRPGTWKLEIERLSGTTTGILDLWWTSQLLGGVNFPVTFTSNNTTSVTTAWSPGTAEAAISPNAYVSKISWRDTFGDQAQYTGPPTTHSICTFTNLGPRRASTAETVYRPDVSVPAYGVVSSLSTVSSIGATWKVEDGLHCINQTFRAAPQSIAVLGGAIALFLEVNPTADPEDVREWVRTNARSDSYTDTTPNATWGYGKLTAFPIQNVSGPFNMSHNIVLPASGQKFRFTAQNGTTFKASTVISANIVGLVNGSPVDPGDAPVITNITSTSFDAQMLIQSQDDVAIVCTNITDPSGRPFAQDIARYSVNSSGTITSWT